MAIFSKSILTFAGLLGLSLLVAGCSPEVGSKEWCDAMKEKPKADWSANEATDFAKSCLL